MNTSEKDKCQRCGAVIRRESTEKLCPACLMSGAMEPPGGKFETVSLAPGESLSLFGNSPVNSADTGCLDCWGAAEWARFTKLNRSPPGAASP